LQIPWPNRKLLILVTSTTGDGDPPENAVTLYKKLKKMDSNQDYLAHINYALLGLGDSNYTTFGGFPQSLDKQLQKLGAKKIYHFKLADDAVGLEIVVDPWVDSLWEALIKQEPCTLSSTLAELKISDSKPPSEVADIPAAVIEQSSNNPPEPERPIQNSDIKASANLDTSPSSIRSLTLSCEPLSKLDLKIPVLSKPYLEIDFLDKGTDAMTGPSLQIYPSPPVTTPIKSAKQLSSSGALKTTLEINIDLSESEFKYEPGDTIGVYCLNDTNEVRELLQRLNLSEQENIPIRLMINKAVADLTSGTKRKYDIPTHLPTSPTTLYHILQHCCEIRSVPKKGLLRTLAEHTSDEREKRRLLELCSAQGSEDYTDFIRQANINILDLLGSFPSCHPPITSLLEHWPRLLARPYSLSSSPLKGRTASFVFNVVEFAAEDGRTYERKGVATGQLERIIREMSIQNCSSELQPTLTFCSRPNAGFKLPSSVETPLILIGPGTGVAPFIGFLAHREELLKLNPNHNYGPVWLFFGCRSKDKDYLYKTELEKWYSSGILTRLSVCFSRENVPPQPKYVQDLIAQYENQLVKMVSKGAIIYVCGDEKNMAKDVMKAITVAFQNVNNLSEEEAQKTIFQLQKDKRYLQDIWT